MTMSRDLVVAYASIYTLDVAEGWISVVFLALGAWIGCVSSP